MSNTDKATDSKALVTKGTYDGDIRIVTERGHQRLTVAHANGLLNRSLLDRITVPTGGGKVWSYTSGGETQGSATIDVVVAAARKQRAWYRLSYDESEETNSPPQCTSLDSLEGWGDPTIDQDRSMGLGPHDCLTCPLAQWGSDRKGGKGQDCAQTIQLVVYFPGDVLPKMLRVPPTSLKSYMKYAADCFNSDRDPEDVVTRLSLRVVKATPPYSVIEFQTVGVLSEDERAKAALGVKLARGLLAEDVPGPHLSSCRDDALGVTERDATGDAFSEASDTEEAEEAEG